MRGDPIRSKAYTFAIEIVRFCTVLQDSHEYILSKQLLKSGTSIAANVEEALSAQSKADFISKMSISLKEARETDFWLRLLDDTGLGDTQKIDELKAVLREILALLVTIIRNTKINANIPLSN